MSGTPESLQRKIKLVGYASITLMTVALLLPLIHLPNQLLFLLGGILVFNLWTNKAFGFELRNGHAKQIPWVNNWFTRADSSLTGNSITKRLVAGDQVDSVLVFGGSAFAIPEDAISILTLGENWYQWEPDIVWDLKPEDRYPANGYSMGAYKTYGKDRVVVYSEAMMFTAQLGGGLSWIKLGMNSKLNPENHRLLLNTIHWLDGSLK